MTSLQNTSVNRSTNSPKRRIVTLTFALLLGMMMFGAMLGFQTRTTHAASNETYMVNIIRGVFGGYSNQAIRIAQCESTMNPNARNVTPIGGSYASGLFQILYPSTWRGTSQAAQSPFNPQANTRAAYELFSRDGHTWRQWQCKA
ncbi:hypothetical protein KDA_62000 [Dictyobacter alpinus]|uniref:Transglycosylase SLT domain-containing protein n=1 Tax=Dictyobacter alpinus TaxID=2014873 RepID=A0A402BH98_9CHLR|nr:transglycosylase SLT domain-containing protein [Dictyobacter alpinus]GCE30716.1 hypothetical protein KDA_62000 [Dictyobacter alpinus]